MMSKALRPLVPAILLVILPACGGSVNKPTEIITPPVTVTSVSVTPATLSARAGDQPQQFAAVATMSNGTTQTVTTLAAWLSSSEQFATVTSGGIATPKSAGETDIRATYQSITGSAHMTVTAVPTPTGLTISGRVREQATSNGISGATVNVKDTLLSTVSDSNGNYSLPGLSPGRIVLRATKAGYDLTEVAVTLSVSVTVDISMPIPGPIATFLVVPDDKTSATGEQCEVQADDLPTGRANRLRCTFDATRSSAPGGVTAYVWSFPVANEPNQTFTGSLLVRPTLKCGFLGSNSSGDREVTLTITHSGGTTSVTRLITYRRNGPC